MTTMASKEFSSTQPLFGCPSPVGTGTAPVLVAEESVYLGNALHDSMATGAGRGGWVAIASLVFFLLDKVASHLLLVCR